MSSITHTGWLAVLAAIIVEAVWWWAKHRARGAARSILGNHFLDRLPRPQHVCFVLRLRDLLFRDPFALLSLLWSDSADEGVAFLRRLWREIGGNRAVQTQQQDGML